MALLSGLFEQRSNFNTLLDVIKLAKREKGGSISAKEALTLTSVFRAASIISGSVASLPLKAMRPDIEHDNRSHEARVPILTVPNPVMTGFELREIQTAHLVLWGNSYTLKIRDGSNRLKELWPIEPGSVTPKLRGDKKIFDIRPRNGKAFEATSDEIMHIPAFGYDGVKGLSPIGLARENISEQINARRYAGGIYRSGAIAAGLIKTDMALKKEQADEIKQRWKDTIGGLENAGDIGVLDRGFSFEKMSMDPQDLQFLETRQFGVVEIARLYGVPPHLLMDVERSTSWGTGIEEQTLGFITYTLYPGYLSRMEKRYSVEVLAGNQFAEFTIEGLLRTRAKDRADVYTRALSPFTGWMTRAEVRELENLPKEPKVEEPEEDPEDPVEEDPNDEVEPNEPGPEDIPGVRWVEAEPVEDRTCPAWVQNPHKSGPCGRAIPPSQDYCLTHRHIKRYGKNT